MGAAGLRTAPVHRMAAIRSYRKANLEVAISPMPLKFSHSWEFCIEIVGQARGLRRPLRPPFFFRKTGTFEEERGHGPRSGRGPAPRFSQMRSIVAKTKWHCPPRS